MGWLRRVKLGSGFPFARISGFREHERPRHCVVEGLEARQLLAACGPESVSEAPVSAPPAGESLSLQLLATRSNRPAAPENLRAKARSSTRIRLTWEDTKGERQFRLYRREAGSNQWVLARKLKKNRTGYIDKNLAAATTYHYRIRAVNGEGASKYSPIVKATTKNAKKKDPPPGRQLQLQWTSAASAPVGRHEAIGTAAGGRLYVFGGFTANLGQRSDAWSYEPKADKWQRLADIPEPMTHGSAVVDGDRIYIAGFFEGEDHHGDGSRNVWVYDISENKWSAGPKLPRRQGAAVLVKSGRNLHFFGGLEPGRGANSSGHWVWHLDKGRKWTKAAPMPNPKDHLAAVELKGRIYAIGGEHLGNDLTMNQSDVHVYNPKTDSWKKRASLPVPWSHHTSSTVVVDGKIIVIAGETDGRVHLRRVMQYDPAADRWTELNALPATRKSPVAGVIGDMIVVHGGEGRGPEATTWVARIG